MSALKRRIFVGNLPPGTVEADIRKKFHKYGKINAVELKQRGDSSTFAFLDLETDPEKLNTCFATVPKKPWNGYEVKLEVAKESFLSRLAKEREHLSMTKGSTETHEGSAQFQVTKMPRKDSQNSPDKLKLPSVNIINNQDLSESSDSSSSVECRGKLKSENSPRKLKPHKFNIVNNQDSSESSDSSSPVESKGKLKMFKGTKHFLSISKQNASNTAQSKKDKKEKLKAFEGTEASAEQGLYAAKKSTDFLQRLEMFSDLWKDSFGSEEFHKQKNDARSAKAEEKRIKSVLEKRKSFQKQKEVIKMALSNVDSKRNSKKIVFEEDMNTSDYREETQSAPDDGSIFPEQKYKLFEDDAEEEIPDWKIRSQFEGKKGQKMLELQSRYAHDERFTLDEKFYESDNEENSGHEDMDQEEEEEEDEKKKQLKILENVLGHSIEPSSAQKKKAKMTSMLRFDPTKPDHAKFEQKVEKKVKFVLEDPDALPKVKKQKSEEPKQVSIPVSKDTFYKVTDTLKDALQNKGQSSGFSLRQMFGANEQDSITEEYESTALKKGKKIGWTSNPFKYDSSDSEEDEDVKEATPTPTPVQEDYNKSTNTEYRETFFFTPDDPRLQEGIDFIKNVQKQNQSFEDFVKLRSELKQIIRSKVKKIKLKKRPFKKKLGGQKKRMKRKV